MVSFIDQVLSNKRLRSARRSQDRCNGAFERTDLKQPSLLGEDGDVAVIASVACAWVLAKVQVELEGVEALAAA